VNERYQSNWPGVRPTRIEAHYRERVVRCFVDRPRSIDDLLRQAAADAPSAIAIVDREKRCTYAQLDAAADAIAAGLESRGIAPGDRVAILMDNRLEFAECFFGIVRAGAIAVPLNIREQRPELEAVLRHSSAKALIHEADLAGRLPTPTSTPDLAYRIAALGMASGSEPLANLYASNSRPPRALREEDVAALLYTSGTTGQPKGVMLTHLSVVTATMHYEFCWDLTCRDRAGMAVPISHVTGLVAILLTMVRVCGTTIMMREFKAKQFVEAATRDRMTYTILVPAQYNLMLLQTTLRDYDLSCWRVGGYGGSLMPVVAIQALAQQLPGVQLVNAYGATETSSPSTLTPLGKGHQYADTVGLPVPCAELVIVDENGCEVPRGTSGEVWISGAHVATGYWEDPEATKASFVGGFWRSGDIGALTEDGHLRILDRTKDLINRGGYKVYSAELENVLQQHGKVGEVAVVPIPDPVLGEKSHAIILVNDSNVTAAELREFCAQRLSDYKIPDYVTFVNQPLPRGTSGKILKRELLRWPVDPANTIRGR
jgi:acyl-CoA synthetase (AMP-forming)/AMP-acid ligase II